ncbi:NAD(P)H-binding protein [Polaribacter tangerinus]|uniref:NAD(P)H-binding protein n=1 Tax=Polaribacter tangerinus TaxID=1920034 RepID=UPI000B4AD0FF|nr:NAD(P)H-binding protein [Polaribacter tangerinus]
MNSISILGAGWLGKELAVSFTEDGFSVKVSTTSEKKVPVLEALGFDTFIVDIETYEEFDDFLNSDILIIAITSKDIDAFERLISQIKYSPIQKIILVSSTGVYQAKNKVVTEQDSVPNSSLVTIENLFKESTFFETTIVRFGGLFGGERHPANWFKDGKKIPQPNGYVNMIHRDDCIEIIHEIIAQNCWNDTFNACASHHPTRREYYTLAKLSKGFQVPEFEEHQPDKWKIISSKKLENTLHYKFIHNDLLKPY